MEKLKVLEMNTEKTWRGGEVHTFYTVKALKHLGVDVTLLAREGFPLAEKARKAGFKVRGVKSNLEALKFLLREGSKFDIIHAQTPKTQGIAVMTKPFHKRPVVCTRLVDYRIKGFLSKLKYRKTDVMVALNKSIKQVLEEAGVKQIEIIPIMYELTEPDVERAKKFLESRGIDLKGKRVVATVAALTEQKDPFTTLEVVRNLLDYRKDFVFLHFGDGHLRSEIEKRIKQLDLEGYYYLLGFVDKPQDFYPLFDVYVMTSLNEGTPLAVLDAFYYEKPVVLSDIEPHREMVGKERGFICPVKTPDCFAKVINDLLTDKTLAPKVTKAAKKWVVENFSLEVLGKRYLDLFQRLI